MIFVRLAYYVFRLAGSVIKYSHRSSTEYQRLRTLVVVSLDA
jgi:hypothetical protein